MTNKQVFKNSEINEKLNHEFDDLILGAKFTLEDLLESIHRFRPIFKDDKAYENTKKSLNSMIKKLSKM